MEDETLFQGTELQEDFTPAETSVPEVKGYQCSRRLGRGAFGEVWAAVQLSTGQEVAIKVLHRQTGLDMAYLRAELHRLRSVSEHPHIVTLLDADLDAAVPYYVMPLLRGGSLADAGKPSVPRAVEWMEQLAGALRFAHDKGLLHCDLKPSNLLLDEEGRVRLVDFGQSTSTTAARGAWGTIGYMPPEQASGESPALSWDIYAFGATLYQLLTGFRPRLRPSDLLSMTGTTARERLEQYAAQLRLQRVIPPRRLNPEVDEDLEYLTLACLRLDAMARPGFDSIVEDFQRRRRGEPLQAARPWQLSYRWRKTMQRYGRPLAVGAAMLVVASLGAAMHATDPYPDVPAAAVHLELPRPSPGEANAALIYESLKWAERLPPSSDLQFDRDSSGAVDDVDLYLWDGHLPGLVDGPWTPARRHYALAVVAVNGNLPERVLDASQAHGFGLKAARYSGDRHVMPTMVTLLKARLSEPEGHLTYSLAAWVMARSYSDWYWEQPFLLPWVELALRQLDRVDLAGTNTPALEHALALLNRRLANWLTPEAILLNQRDLGLQFLEGEVRASDMRHSQRYSLQMPAYWSSYRGAIAREYRRAMDHQVELMQRRDFHALFALRTLLVRPATKFTLPGTLLHPVKLGSAWLVSGLTPGALDLRGRAAERISTPECGLGYLWRRIELQFRAEKVRVRIAQELYRRQHGRPANSLTELVPRWLPGVPRDPFQPRRELTLQHGELATAGPPASPDGSLWHILHPGVGPWP